MLDKHDVNDLAISFVCLRCKDSLYLEECFLKIIGANNKKNGNNSFGGHLSWYSVACDKICFHKNRRHTIICFKSSYGGSSFALST